MTRGMFSTTTVLALCLMATTTTTAAEQQQQQLRFINNNDVSISSQSAIGQHLLSKARSLENNNNQYTSWMANYSLKFDGCSSVPDFEREEGLRARLLAKFKLCPDSSSCSSCSHAGEYVVELREFVEAYRSAQYEAHAYECETQEESCEYTCQNGGGNYGYGDDYNNGNNNNNNNNGNNNNNNNNNNEDYCKYQCMADAGMSYCNDEGEGGEEMRDLGECRAIEDGNDNNNNNNNYNQYGGNNGNNNGNSNYQMYYVGAYCTSSGVYIGTFSDSSCTKKAPSGTFESKMGYSLPTDPVVTYDCISCKQSYNDDDNNNNNGNNYDTVLETCTELYEQAGRCESNMKDDSMYYKDTSACTMIHTTLGRLDRAFASSMGRGPSAATILAWLFGVSIIGMGLYIHVLRRRLKRSNGNVGLLESNGTPA